MMRRAFRIPFARTPRRQLAREVDDELAFHLDSRVERLVAQGWDPEAARGGLRIVNLEDLKSAIALHNSDAERGVAAIRERGRGA